MIKIAVLGYGTVGSGVVEVIQTNQKVINERVGEELDIKYVLDLRDFPGTPVEKLIVHDFEQIVNDDEVKIVVEVMGGIEPAYTFVKRSLLAGKSVATSNKALVAKHGAELLAIAKEKHINFLYEASVGGGIPIIRPMNCALTAEKIESIHGILNGTTNYILTKMDKEGADFEDVLKEYTLEMHYRLFDTCADEWVKYATVRIAESFKKQWEPIKALNPKAKRSSYGPIPIYSVQYKTAYSTKFFGQDSRNLDKVFDGFWQYEDYPKWCDYHYGVGAFSLMTYKLYSPSTTIRPEVYTSTLEAYCPDGFVGKALPTKEHYYHPTYVNASQMLEYAYNTAYFRDGSFGYWNDNCYMWWPHPEIGEVNPIMDFLEAQRKILSYRPSHPKKAITFVVDFIPEEDVLDHEIHHDSIYNISEANVTFENNKKSFEYTGDPIKPSIELKTSDNKLIETQNYTLEYLNNTNVGQATILIKGQNNYTGQKEVTFNITKATNSIEVKYDKNQNISEIKSSFGKIEFLYFSDQECKNQLNKKPTNPGTYYLKAIVDGTENYQQSEKVIEFKIEKQNNIPLIIGLSVGVPTLDIER